MIKKFIAILLIFIMLAGLVPTAALASNDNIDTELANILKELALFKGISDNDFALERAPTRTEALIMLIRVLGKENAAVASVCSHPFTDVPEWAERYVGYAYEHGLTNGVSATKFGSSQAANAQMYLTFTLRALGYSDNDGLDFTYTDPYTLSEKAGLLTGNPNLKSFMRADVVRVSYAALDSKLKDNSATLAEKLINDGVFSGETFMQCYDFTLLSKCGAIDIIELTSSEEIYALSRILSPWSTVSDVYMKDPDYSFANDFDHFDIPSELTTTAEKRSYLQTASYKLMNDVDLTVQTGTGTNFFIGIGSSKSNGGTPFKGTFDGNGKTINLSTVQNMEINKSMSNYIGLFGETSDAKIINTNVKIVDDIIVSNALAAGGTLAQGGLVGFAETTKFNNCSITISNSDVGVACTDKDNYSISYIGGLVGQSKYSIYNNCKVLMENSSIIATGQNPALSTVYSMFSVGGLMGFSNNGSDNTNTIGSLGNQLYNCSVVSTNTSQQDVVVARIRTGEEITAGGLVGCSFNNLVVHNCSVEITRGNIVAEKTGVRDADSDYGTQAGGIIGRNEHTGELYNCNVTGDYLKILSKSPNNWSSAGGIVGVDIGPWHRDVISLNNCSFEGSGTSNIQVQITSTNVVDSKKYVTAGGIVGEGGYKINGCTVNNTTITNKSAGIKQEAYAGSIVGGFNLEKSDSANWKSGAYFTPGTPGITDCSVSGVKFDVSDNVVVDSHEVN